MVRFLHCRDCGDELHDPVHTLAGFCWDCREQAAIDARKAWCIAPLHKSNYMLITNKQDLQGLNNKGGLVR